MHRCWPSRHSHAAMFSFVSAPFSRAPAAFARHVASSPSPSPPSASSNRSFTSKATRRKRHRPVAWPSLTRSAESPRPNAASRHHARTLDAGQQYVRWNTGTTIRVRIPEGGEETPSFFVFTPEAAAGAPAEAVHGPEKRAPYATVSTRRRASLSDGCVDTRGGGVRVSASAGGSRERARERWGTASEMRAGRSGIGRGARSGGGVRGGGGVARDARSPRAHSARRT